MMLAFLNAGFGAPLDWEDFSLLKSLGFQGIRQDVPAFADVGPLVLNALEDPERRAIFVLSANDAASLAREVAASAVFYRVEDRTIIEVGNELDIQSSQWASPAAARQYGAMVAQIYRQVSNISKLIRVLTGGISNPSKRGLEWLLQALPSIPPEVGVAFHTYRNGPAQEPLEGYPSRSSEFRALHAIAGSRALWNTETGWSMAPRKRPFPECLWKGRIRLTADEVGARLAEEIHLNRLYGAKSVCVYQLNDGPTDTDQDRFGLRDFSGEPKVAICDRVRGALNV